MEEAVNKTLQKLKAVQIEVNQLIRAGSYAEAIVESEAKYRLATSLQHMVTWLNLKTLLPWPKPI